LFLSVEHDIRGALLMPVSAARDESTHILVDTVDADMFLRADVQLVCKFISFNCRYLAIDLGKPGKP
jgi:hypothetical protein